MVPLARIPTGEGAQVRVRIRADKRKAVNLLLADPERARGATEKLVSASLRMRIADGHRDPRLSVAMQQIRCASRRG
jgi:hypothetical protein